MQIPQHIEAEQYVIGSILLENELMDDAITLVTHEDFYKIEHNMIFEAMEQLNKEKKPIDPVMLMDKLKNSGVITFPYIADFIKNTAGTFQFNYYIKIIKEKAAKRKLIKISEDIKQMSFKGNNELSDIINQCTKDIQALEIYEHNELNYVPDMVDEVLAEIKQSNKTGCIAGLKTGFHELDRLTGGWQAGRYYLIGARPKIGKTSLFCQIAETAANQVPTVIFSLEMTKKELVKLLIYQNSTVDSMLEQNGQLTQLQFNKMENATSLIKNKQLYINDTVKTMPELKAELKNIQKDLDRRNKGKIGLVVIDFVQRLHGSKNLNRNYQLEEISREIKDMTKDLNLCVLAVSSLSRAVDERDDKKPLPSDLRDSGSFEFDCDGLMLMYRDSYYKGQTPDNTHKYKMNDEEVLADVVDINMFLNRHGKADKFQLHFLTPYRKFVSKSDFYVIETKTPWDD
jgi:replicative DNA helicase